MKSFALNISMSNRQKPGCSGRKRSGGGGLVPSLGRGAAQTPTVTADHRWPRVLMWTLPFHCVSPEESASGEGPQAPHLQN